MSWFLREAGREHVVLDRRSTLGGGWQDRWDAFQLVTPNWSSSFPGFSYDGPDPDGFMPRDEIAGRVSRYARAIEAPLSLETEVQRVTRGQGGDFLLETSSGPLAARQVVIATGAFQVPRIPPIAGQLPGRLAHVHSHEYRNESDLPPGAVLVVGTGQSGMQIAEELVEAGRRVYVSVGSAGRIPRRYRGRDFFHWLSGIVNRGAAVGVSLPTVDNLPDPRMRTAGNPHVSGHGGGHDTNLRQFAATGMTLLGRIERVEGERVRLAADLAANLAWADQFFDVRFRPLFDSFIELSGIDAPPDDRLPVDFEPGEIRELDLSKAAIGTILWTTGYRAVHDWIELPILDENGKPHHLRGVTEVPGLYFLGLLWQHNLTSATLLGVAHDAQHLARHMGLGIDWEPLAAPSA
jgi:putative flavoprotein involved in K+ transport